MIKDKVILGMALAATLVLSGCVARTYQLTRDRVDQDLETGNRGYLQGSKPASEERERSTTRTTQVVEIELGTPIRFKSMPDQVITSRTESIQAAETVTDESEGVSDSGGYITSSAMPEVSGSSGKAGLSYKKYTVRKNDTLQKISQKFFGTTRKWKDIYEANRDTLKTPNSIYPGQSINIPVEGVKEPKANLK